MKKALWTLLPNAKLTSKKERKPIRRVSKSMAKKKLRYNALLDSVYGTNRTKVCRCAFPSCHKPMSDNHHSRGKLGSLLTDSRWFVPLCREHHDWVAANPLKAMETFVLNPHGKIIQLLCAKGQWNTP